MTYLVFCTFDLKGASSLRIMKMRTPILSALVLVGFKRLVRVEIQLFLPLLQWVNSMEIVRQKYVMIFAPK